MERRARKTLAAPLIEVRRQLERWRSSRGRRGRIPEHLWEAAVELARVHGPPAVARTLGLNQDSLTRRLEASIPAGETELKPIYLKKGTRVWCRVVNAPSGSSSPTISRSGGAESPAQETERTNSLLRKGLIDLGCREPAYRITASTCHLLTSGPHLVRKGIVVPEGAAEIEVVVDFTQDQP